MRVTLYYNVKEGLNNPLVREVRKRAEYNFGADNIRLQGLYYAPTTPTLDEARQGRDISLSIPDAGIFGLEEIRSLYPLPNEVKKENN